MKKLISMFILLSGIFVPQNMPAMMDSFQNITKAVYEVLKFIDLLLNKTTEEDLPQLNNVSKCFQKKFQEKGFLDAAEKQECFTEVARSIAPSVRGIEQCLAQLGQSYSCGNLDKNNLISELHDAQAEIVHFRNRLEQASPHEISDEDAARQFSLMLKINECITLLNNTSQAGANYDALPNVVNHGGFTGETLVQIPNKEFKQIRELKVGDQVVCYDRDGYKCSKPVLSVAYQNDQPIYRYEFFLSRSGYRLGSFCSSRDYAHDKFSEAITVGERVPVGTGRVYMIEVADHHHFCITDWGLVVHNGSWSRAIYIMGGICALAGGVCLAVAAAPVAAATATTCAIWGAGLGAAGVGGALLGSTMETQEQKHKEECRDNKAHNEPEPSFCTIL